MADQPREVQRILEAIAALETIIDDAERAKAASLILEQWPSQHARLREVRQQAVLNLKAGGQTWQQIGALLGVHYTRAQQIGVGKRGDKREQPVAEKTPASARRERLLAAIRAAGGQWDWRRAWETYEDRPEPYVVRRDLQELCKARHLVRVEQGIYEAA
jgi:hypothetical protein